MARQIETVASEFEGLLEGFGLTGWDHLRDLRDEAGLVDDIDGVRRQALFAGPHYDQNRADRAPQLVCDRASVGAQSFWIHDRQGNALEARAAGLRQALGHLGAAAGAVRDARQPRAHRRIPTDHHDPAAHGNARASLHRCADDTLENGLLPACYTAVIRPRRRWAKLGFASRRREAMRMFDFAKSAERGRSVSMGAAIVFTWLTSVSPSVAGPAVTVSDPPFT